MNPKYHIFPFYKMYSDSTSLRRAKEHYFIKLLKPKLNRVTWPMSSEYSQTNVIFSYKSAEHVFGCSKEPSRGDGSFECPKHTEKYEKSWNFYSLPYFFLTDVFFLSDYLVTYSRQRSKRITDKNIQISLYKWLKFTIVSIQRDMSQNMWFPTMWHFDKCRLRLAFAAAF